MIVEKTYISNLLLIKPDVFRDLRGYFYESFGLQKYEKEGIDAVFVQDNVSRSVKGTLRGLHYQIGTSAQGKLCGVLLGRVLDIAVDIRFGSPTYGKYFSVELNDESHNQLWIPPGFAHGFSVLSETAIFSYKCTAPYDKANERAIIYNDATLNIDWKNDAPLVSQKDLLAKNFVQIDHDFIYKID
jgi:dTDP-4-dehydrorhamnose 3,5-epimerase